MHINNTNIIQNNLNNHKLLKREKSSQIVNLNHLQNRQDNLQPNKNNKSKYFRQWDF